MKKKDTKIQQKETEEKKIVHDQHLESKEENKSSNDEKTEEKKNDQSENEINVEKKEVKKKKKKEKSKTEELEEKLEIVNDKYLRLSAEYDNYRKRTLKERMELMKSAGEDILINFLPVMDNIDRANLSVTEAKDIEAVKEGIQLIHKNLADFLKERGVIEMDSKGEIFNTDLHEAITKIPAPEEAMKGKVVDVIEKGYMIKDKVLRYAKVVVGE